MRDTNGSVINEKCFVCGAAEVNITPPLGLSIPGKTIDRLSEGIRDELYAKAAVISCVDDHAVFLAVDAIALTAGQIGAIRKRIFEFTDIPEKNIMISATHTHTGGPVVDIYRSVKDDGYIDHMIKKSADAVILAYKNRKHAGIRSGKGAEYDISFNRRWRYETGVFDYTNLDTRGLIDPDVPVIRIDDINGKCMALIVSFACHTDTVNLKQYCADYPGEISRTLKKIYGNDCVVLFMLGACGDLNHRSHNRQLDFSKGIPDEKDIYMKIGRILSGEIIRICEKSEIIKDYSIKTATEFVDIKLRTPSDDDVDRAEKTIHSSAAESSEYMFANEIVRSVVPETRKIELQVLCVADTAISAIPGEVFTEYGIKIKMQSPFKHNIINTLANGAHGYIITKKAFLQSGYEARLTQYTRLPYEAGEVITEKIIQMHKILHK